MAATSDKLPALPWYPKDFAADEPVIAMTLEAEGAYRRLLDHQWLHGSIPSDFRLLAGICKGISVRKMKSLWNEIGMLFSVIPDDPERMQNAKLERVRQERQDFIEQQRESGREGARRRWHRRNDNGPNRGPNGVATNSPMAEVYPASASTSAKEQPSNNNNGAARVEPAASWPNLHAQLPPTGLYRQQVMAFIASLPDAQAEGWCALLLQTLAGIGTPGGVKVTPDELLTTIATYTASRTGEHDTRYFAGCLRNVVKRRYARDAVPAPKAGPPTDGPKLPRLTDPDLDLKAAS